MHDTPAGEGARQQCGKQNVHTANARLVLAGQSCAGRAWSRGSELIANLLQPATACLPRDVRRPGNAGNTAPPISPRISILGDVIAQQ